MGERLKELRKTLGLTLESFGEKVGVGKSSISRLENGTNNLTEQMILAICREFDVNENWLRTGEGEMFIKLDREMEIARLTKDLLLEEEDSFKNKVVTALAKLTPEQWKVLSDMAEALLKKTRTRLSGIFPSLRKPL